MAVYYEGNKKYLFLGKGRMKTGGSSYRMWADCPSIAMAGSSGYGTNYEPSDQIVIDWIQSAGLYPFSPTSYDVAYFDKTGNLFNLNRYDYTGASHTSVALTSAPNSIKAFRGSVKPYEPWSDPVSMFHRSELLPNHGNSSSYGQVSPNFVAFSRRASDSDKDYYIGNMSSMRITQRLLLCSKSDSTPTVINTIFVATDKNTFNEPFMFFGATTEDYLAPTQGLSSSYKKQFTIPKDSSPGVDTMYTLFEDSVVYPFAQYSAASVGPFVVVSAPGFSYTISPISGTDSPVTIVRGTLGISFF